MNPIFPDAQSWDNLLIAIAAVVIVFLNRRQLFQRGSGVMEVFSSEGNDCSPRAVSACCSAKLSSDLFGAESDCNQQGRGQSK